ncbi:cytochrome c oxidase assembly protein [Actinotalea sp. BY-33]|uniref:Cytochrome c oxidase assembly protein n=1 Tax=Actinotalea soli TaxID=2819234 RepID=A0A939LRE7_9CELL|nr:cytochrome c oxidase assembly protein [Actinotalea soli]MBO1751670.1 cytochrome c oxidase assembly protein [Actinotalea soli]
MTWWEPMILGCALLGLYLAVLLRRPSTLPRWPRRRLAAWVVGVLVVAVALSPPLADLARLDHRAHMVQHLLLGMYAPIVLVFSAPVTLLLGTLRPADARLLARGLRSPPVRTLTHPVTAAVLSVGGLFALYLTPLYGLTQVHAGVHGLVLAHLLLAGYVYTWSIAGPDPAPHRPGLLTRVAVLVLAAGSHAFLARLLHAQAVRGADHHSGHGGTQADADGASMATAAQWMYYGGDGAEILLAVMLFSWWYQSPYSSRRRSHTSLTVG